MSTNCVRCIKNNRTGFDLLCDGCREEINSWEKCQRCGGRYPTVWDAPDDLWAQVTGKTDGSGLRCLSCFDEEARQKDIVLYWSCCVGKFPKIV